MMFVRVLSLAVATVAACDLLPRERTERAVLATAADSVCAARFRNGALPAQLRETSGLARGSGERMWTHNDGSDPLLYAIDGAGRVVQRVHVDGITLDDWEDIDAGPCDGGRCLYIADIGDNDGERRSIAIHIVPEPAADAASTSVRATLHARYPDRPQDAEGLFVTSDGSIYIVTKGRHGPVVLYRYAAPHRPDATVTLEHVHTLAPQPRDRVDFATAATTSPDGRWLLGRTYDALLVHPLAELLAREPVQPIRIGLAHLRHPQGEGVAVDGTDGVWLTSEAEAGGAPVWTRLDCRLDDLRR